MAGYRRVDAFLAELILTIPVVIFSEMFAQLLGYLLRDFIGAAAPAFAYCNRVGERRSERARSFRSSLNQSTTLPIAMQTSHWSQLSGTVPKAVLRNPMCTTAIWRTTDSAMAPHSHRLTNKWWNALVVSERALKQLNS